MIENDGIPPLPNYYPAEPSSIPRSTQATWLDRPSTPLVHADVFMRRRNFVTSDLHVLLVTMDKAERQRMKVELGGLHYSTTAVSSGKVAQAMLSERGGEFHLVMISAALNGEGLDCLGLLAWIRDVPALREVSLIVLGSFSVEPANAIALIKAGATDILTRPVAVEALMRLRHAVGTSQSLTQQRAHRREEGGTRLVTQYIMRKEREGRAEGLPPSVLTGGAERRDGSEPPRSSARSNALLGEVTVSVLLMQRESRKAAELPALLSECGYQVKVARTKHEVLKHLTARHASWSLLCIDYGSEHAPTLHPGQADFGGQVAFVLREMASRQLLVPTVAFQEEATTERVVRTMRAGLAELYLPPYTKPKLRGLLRYVLKPAELRELSEEAKALHAVQQSTSSYGGGGASGGTGGGGGTPPSAGGGGAGRPRRVSTEGVSVPAGPLTPAATFALARMESVRAVSPPRHNERRTLQMLSLARVEREVAAAAHRLAAMDMGEGGESLTKIASNRRAAQEEIARRTKATANDENDEKLHASREALEAYARAAEGAKRNAVRLAAVLEREVAMGNAGRSRDILEQRCAAALISASPRFEWPHPTSPRRPLPHDHMLLHTTCRVRAQGVGCERGRGGASEPVCGARVASTRAGRHALIERRRRARGGAAAAR